MVDLLGEVSRLSDALRAADRLAGLRRAAVLAALEAGHSARVVAKAAGISAQRVYAMTREQPPSTRRTRPKPPWEPVDF
jgi:transposase